MYVYIISFAGLHKIGRTNNIRRRMASLQLPGKPQGTWWRVGDSVTAEKRLHDRFKAQRAYGEWFRMTEADLDEADDMLSEQMTIHLHCASALSRKPFERQAKSGKRQSRQCR